MQRQIVLPAMSRELSVTITVQDGSSVDFSSVRKVANVQGTTISSYVESEMQTRTIVDSLRRASQVVSGIRVTSHVNAVANLSSNVLGAIIGAENTLDLDMARMNYDDAKPCRGFVPGNGPIHVLTRPNRKIYLVGDQIVFSAPLAEYYASGSGCELRPVVLKGRQLHDYFALGFAREQWSEVSIEYLPPMRRRCFGCGQECLEFANARMARNGEYRHSVHCETLGLGHDGKAHSLFIPANGIAEFVEWTHGTENLEPVFSLENGPGRWAAELVQDLRRIQTFVESD